MSSRDFASCIYEGRVTHYRREPQAHKFTYRVALLYLQLDELERAFKRRWFWSSTGPALAWFRRADFFGDPNQALGDAVRERVATELNWKPTGPIRVLAHLRYFGVMFNPVSFYYCYDDEQRLGAIVAEITNTPWGERHAYVLDFRGGEPKSMERCFEFAKAFHVSPFMPMDQVYRWRMDDPGETLAVTMTSHQGGEAVFRATMRLTRRPLSSYALARTLLGYPLMTLQVLVGIYWQALRLYGKRTPVFAHPKNVKSSESSLAGRIEGGMSEANEGSISASNSPRLRSTRTADDFTCPTRAERVKR